MLNGIKKKLRSSYATGDRSYTLASTTKGNEVFTIQVDGYGDSEDAPPNDIHKIQTHKNEIKSPDITLDTKKHKSG